MAMALRKWVNQPPPPALKGSQPPNQGEPPEKTCPTTPLNSPSTMREHSVPLSSPPLHTNTCTVLRGACSSVTCQRFLGAGFWPKCSTDSAPTSRRSICWGGGGGSGGRGSISRTPTARAPLFNPRKRHILPGSVSGAVLYSTDGGWLVTDGGALVSSGWSFTDKTWLIPGSRRGRPQLKDRLGRKRIRFEHLSVRWGRILCPTLTILPTDTPPKGLA